LGLWAAETEGAKFWASSEEAGRAALEQFGESWRAKYPLIYQSRDAAWPVRVFKYPEEIRRAVYTTNAIESLNSPLRKVARNRSALASGFRSYEFYLHKTIDRLHVHGTCVPHGTSYADQRRA
jgi:transposase-like protein